MTVHPNYKTAIGKAIRLPLRLIPDGAVVPVIRGPLQGMKWVVGSSINGCWLGTYEPEKVALICKEDLKGKLFLDIGANVGFYSLLAASRGAEVIAFEPLPRNVEYIERHSRLNQLSIQVRPEAVSDQNKEVRFNSQCSNSEGSIAELGDLIVKAVTLDSLCLSPSFMKIDVEGGELRVLLGAKETLIRSHPVIFLATHDNPGVEEGCLEFLSALGYECRCLAHHEYVCR